MNQQSPQNNKREKIAVISLTTAKIDVKNGNKIGDNQMNNEDHEDERSENDEPDEHAMPAH